LLGDANQFSDEHLQQEPTPRRSGLDAGAGQAPDRVDLIAEPSHFELHLFEIRFAGQNRLHWRFGKLPQPYPTFSRETLKLAPMIRRLWLDCQANDVANDLRYSLAEEIATDGLA
jgi:hypothetical protein